jgi:hypothetical protein
VRSGERFYHARTAGVTGGDEGGDRLVIRLPWLKPEFGSEYGGPLVSPEGWPPRWSPVSGETLAAFWDRTIVEDSFLQQITPLTSDRRPVPSLDGWRPADLTLAWWERKWPFKVFDRREDDSPPRGYHRDRVFWRLVVEFSARLGAGDLVVKARRLDASESDDPKPVKPGLLRNPFMVLRPHAPHGGWFRPEQWHGSEPPPSLLEYQYRDLTLWPAEVAETERETSALPGMSHPPPQTPSDAYTACVACLRAVADASPKYRNHTRPELERICKGSLTVKAWRRALDEAFEGDARAKWRDTGKRGKP